MTIDPKTLPDGTVVESASGEHVRYVNGDALVANRKHVGIPDLGLSFPVGRVFVPVPDGVTYDDALRAVQDAAKWVPTSYDAIPTGARARLVETFTRGKADEVAEWFIHPDDVPDPDADLIERIARAIHERMHNDPRAFLSDDLARAALAVIREDGAR